MKKIYLFLSVALLAFTACSRDDNPAGDKTAKELVGSWICQYDEDGINRFDDIYDHVVEYYRFMDDGTGFYELYYFKDNELLALDFGRDWFEDFRYTVKDGQVTVTYEMDDMSWTLHYANKQLTDPDGHLFTPSTAAQDKQVLDWFTSQHIAGDEDITTPVNEGYTDEPARARKHP